MLGANNLRSKTMSRKTIIALLAAASVAVLAPNVALAHGGGGGGGGGGHGGGGGGGRGGGGGFGGGAAFHSGAIGGGGSAFRSGAIVGGGPGGMRVGGFTANSRAFTANNGFHRGFDHHGAGFNHRRFRNPGFAFVGAYAFDDYYDYYDYPYGYDDSYYDNGNCYVVQRRVHTRAGWRVRPVQVCG
jgi:hypothetical protein